MNIKYSKQIKDVEKLCEVENFILNNGSAITEQDKEILTQTRISEYINSPITSVNYWITKFNAIGLIISAKDIKLTDKGLKLFKHLCFKLYK